MLTDVRIPPALSDLAPAASGWCEADLLIEAGNISAVEQSGTLDAGGAERIDAGRGILVSGLVDCHTHLDKAHVAAFEDFPPCDLAGAMAAMAENKKTWTPENLRKRVEFSLRTAYAYGVRAMRSHVDFSPETPGFVWPVMCETVAHWRGRLDLQLSPLANIVHFEDPEFRRGIYDAAREQGRIGLFLFDQPDLTLRLTPIFEHASAQGWDIDLHVDEGLDDRLDGLNAVAAVTLATGFKGTVLCGHCVALNTYDEGRRERVVARSLDAGLHFVSLPVTNLYLQGREENGLPQLRGMTPVRYLTEMGAKVSLGADNVRDGFCAVGEFDPIAVLNLGAQVGHLDEAARNWSALITRNPAETMGLDWDGRIVPGAPADLVLFSTRSASELSARGGPRFVIRGGKWLNEQPPDFRELNE